MESFNGKLEDELLGREIFTSLTEAKVLVEQYRVEYNHERPHSSLGYLTPAAFAARSTEAAPASGEMKDSGEPEFSTRCCGELHLAVLSSQRVENSTPVLP